MEKSEFLRFFFFLIFRNFLDVLTIFEIFFLFLGFIMDFFIFRFLYIYIYIFFSFSDFFCFFGIPFKVTKVTTKSYQGYYCAPKIAKNGPKQHNRLLLLPKGQTKALTKGQSPPQELEVGPHSGPYLLVALILGTGPQ